MVETIPKEAVSLILLFSAIFFILRISKWRIKIALVLAFVATIVIPLGIPNLFQKFHEFVLSFGASQVIAFSAFLFFVGVVAGMKGKKIRKLSDIESLGKLEFEKADLIGKLSLARAKKDKRTERVLKKEIERVEREIENLKRKLWKHI